MALASSTYCRFTSARLAPAPVRIKVGGDAPSRRHSRHPSRPRRRRDDWGVGNPVALASSTYCRFTSARLAPAPVRIKVGGNAPPAVILGTPVVHAEGGTTGVPGIQWLLPVAPTVISPRPPAVILGTPVVHAEGGTTGAGGIQWLLQVAPTVVSPQRVLLPPPSASKKVGMPLPPSFSAPQSSTPKAGRLGCRESSGYRQ